MTSMFLALFTSLDEKLLLYHVQQKNIFEGLTSGNMMNSGRKWIFFHVHTKSCSVVLPIVQAVLLNSLLLESLLQDVFCPMTSSFKCTHPSSCLIILDVTDVLYPLKLMGKNKEKKNVPFT